MVSLIPGTFNARDLGGLPLVGGGTVRGGVLLRSDALAAAEDGAALLADVGTVIDLRTAQERDGAPDALPGPPGPRVLERPLLEGAVSQLAPQAAGGAEHMADAAAEGGGGRAAPELGPEQVAALRARIPTLPELYLSMIEHGAATFADCARAVAAPEDPQRPGVLIHCTAGKDRTGVAVALLLDAVGARREAIIADYTRSQDELAGPWAERMLEGMRRAGIPPLPEIEQLACATPVAAIDAVLEAIDARGGAASYLREGGLSEEELTALRTKLRDDAADDRG